MDIASRYVLRGHTIKNRLGFPPVNIFNFHGPDGISSPAAPKHYGLRAIGNGVVTVEATCVLPEGRNHPSQIGIWSDRHLDGLTRIASAIKEHSTLALIQLHHSGPSTHEDIGQPVGPVDRDVPGKHVRGLTKEEVDAIRDAFIVAAMRAHRAGFDGVELHGAHGFLLNNFMNPVINTRNDIYGDPLELVRQIYNAVRTLTNDKFVITMRVGVDNPTMEDGIRNCQSLELMGFDMLSISSGIRLGQPLPMPDDFPYSALAWRGCEVKKHVNLPIMGVGELHKNNAVHKVITSGALDFALVGRAQLADPLWAEKLLSGLAMDTCLDCPTCSWFTDYRRCPREWQRNKP